MQIVRRSSLDEKFLVIVKQRFGHFCTKIWLVIAILSWDGVQRQKADYIYDKLKHVLPEYGIPTEVSTYLHIFLYIYWDVNDTFFERIFNVMEI